MAMKRKAADPAAMDQLEAQDVASFGEDPELLDPAEQALLEGGNAANAQPPAPPQESDKARPATERTATERSSEDRGTAGRSGRRR